MDFTTLHNEQRYLFHIKSEHNCKPFRADLVDIIYNYNGTIRFTKVRFQNIEDDTRNYRFSTLVTMPIDWIEKVETLETILEETNNNQLMLVPSELLIEIDRFL